jgi:Actin like proteins N terminal domain
MKNVMYPIVSVEPANSTIKAYDLTGKESYYYNTLQEAPRKFEGDNDVKVYTFRNKRWIVGSLVGKGIIKSTSKGATRYDDENYYIQGILAVAQHVKNGDIVNIVTGVPSEHWTNDCVTRIINGFKGHHKVEINGEPRHFTINDVGTLIQPEGTYYHVKAFYTQQKNQAIIDRLKKNVCVIDIGMGSTDVSVFLHGAEDKSFDAEISMVDILNEIIRRAKVKHHGTVLETAKLEILAVDESIRDRGAIHYSNRDYPVKEIVESVYKEMVEQMIKNINQTENLHNFDLIIFTGGGFTTLYDNIADYMEGHTNIILTENSAMNNAYGFLEYGKSIFYGGGVLNA